METIATFQQWSRGLSKAQQLHNGRRKKRDGAFGLDEIQIYFLSCLRNNPDDFKSQTSVINALDVTARKFAWANQKHWWHPKNLMHLIHHCIFWMIKYPLERISWWKNTFLESDEICHIFVKVKVSYRKFFTQYDNISPSLLFSNPFHQIFIESSSSTSIYKKRFLNFAGTVLSKVIQRINTCLDIIIGIFSLWIKNNLYKICALFIQKILFVIIKKSVIININLL